MFEVEVKIQATHDSVREHLDSLDATHRGRTTQVDTYFDHPERSFHDTDEALRIRREHPANGTPEGSVTYKGPVVDTESKTREEFETRVHDAAAMEWILIKLGFTRVAAVHKERDRYDVNGYVVTLDQVDDLGEFVEIETTGEEADIEALRAGAQDVVTALGLDPGDHIRASYLELLLEE